MITVCLAVVSALVLASCGGDDSEESAGSGGQQGEQQSAASDLRVGLALAGPRNDEAFYQTNLEAVETVQEDLGFELSVVDSLEETQAQIDALTNLAQAGNDVVVAGGAAFTQGVESVSTQFPDTYFVLSGGVTPTAHDNVTSLAYDWGVASYVAGRVMAAETEAGRIGVIGGLEAPPTTQSVAAIKAAAEDHGGDVEVLENTVGSFSDAAKAKSAAAAMVADGVDYIYAFLDAGLVGVAQAIEESGEDVTFFGPVRPRCDEFGEGYAGATSLTIDPVISETLTAYAEDTIEPGVTYLGLEGQDFELCPDYENPGAQEVADEVKAGIEDGSIELPDSVRNVRPEYYEGDE